ncbi:hypothetical protein PGT21_019810 [Puccinia graminis f. sp. tritici]|uniref:Uncharacterized protein n=1 Tax=Puccinia graminis f. sp. tritici TaxID=56615 RepID=A0A5B0MP43_PUCGR|nr:hypothetical protein PGT21_019810 [Puccinia graminis f. sp. tritici]
MGLIKPIVDSLITIGAKDEPEDPEDDSVARPSDVSMPSLPPSLPKLSSQHSTLESKNASAVPIPPYVRLPLWLLELLSQAALCSFSHTSNSYGPSSTQVWKIHLWETQTTILKHKIKQQNKARYIPSPDHANPAPPNCSPTMPTPLHPTVPD